MAAPAYTLRVADLSGSGVTVQDLYTVPPNQRLVIRDIVSTSSIPTDEFFLYVTLPGQRFYPLARWTHPTPDAVHQELRQALHAGDLLSFQHPGLGSFTLVITGYGLLELPGSSTSISGAGNT